MAKSKFMQKLAFVGKKILYIVKFERVLGKNDPQAMPKRIRNTTRIAVLLGLLILISVIVIILLRGSQFTEPPHGSVNIPGNIIDPAPGVVTPNADLEFNTENSEENLPFDVEGMNSGSSETIDYRVVATYNSDFILKYDMTIRENEEFQKLAEILKIKAELVGADGSSELYNGLLADMEALRIELSADTESVAEYLFRITLYLDTPLKEEYYGQRLIADMAWWIDGQDNISIANCEFTTADAGGSPSDSFEMSFIQLNDGDNTAFNMKNIKDGDSETKYFAFEVFHDQDVKILLENNIVLDTLIDEVLWVKVELIGENGSTVLYEGSLNELSAEHTVLKNDKNKTTLYYKVTVTVNSLTAAHFGNKLICDLSWSIAGTSEELKVPSNTFIISSTPYAPSGVATSIKLTEKDGYDNLPFNVENMLPGDAEKQYYCVSVTHDRPLTVRFAIDVDDTQMLSEVMRVKVEQLVPDAEDRLLYDGLMKECSEVDVSVTMGASVVSEIYYRVTVYTVGAEVDNEYVGQSLSADFSWELQ